MVATEVHVVCILVWALQRTEPVGEREIEDGWMDEWIDGWIDGWMDDGWMNG